MTLAAFTLARLVPAATSSTEAAAARASTATSSRSAARPALIGVLATRRCHRSAVTAALGVLSSRRSYASAVSPMLCLARGESYCDCTVAERCAQDAAWAGVGRYHTGPAAFGGELPA